MNIDINKSEIHFLLGAVMKKKENILYLLRLNQTKKQTEKLNEWLNEIQLLEDKFNR